MFDGSFYLALLVTLLDKVLPFIDLIKKPLK